MSEPRLPDLARSFERHLRAENKSERTVEDLPGGRPAPGGLPVRRGVGLAEADRAHIQAFLADLLARWKPATAANRYRSLKVFYAWLEEEGEIAADPMAKMKPRPFPSSRCLSCPMTRCGGCSRPVLARTSRPAGSRSGPLTADRPLDCRFPPSRLSAVTCPPDPRRGGASAHAASLASSAALPVPAHLRHGRGPQPLRRPPAYPTPAE
jgi:Phage integrase, N-terminal SAM-like domain